MTHLSPVGGAMPLPPIILSRGALNGQIALRRARLAELEAEMIAACEAAALGKRSRTNPTAARQHWGRTAWHRYL